MKRSKPNWWYIELSNCRKLPRAGEPGMEGHSHCESCWNWEGAKGAEGKRKNCDFLCREMGWCMFFVPKLFQREDLFWKSEPHCSLIALHSLLWLLMISDRHKISLFNVYSAWFSESLWYRIICGFIAHWLEITFWDRWMNRLSSDTLAGLVCKAPIGLKYLQNSWREYFQVFSREYFQGTMVCVFKLLDSSHNAA